MPADDARPDDAPDPDPRTLRILRRRLLAWYDRHRRDLPWRPPLTKPGPHEESRPDAYRVLVSEAMLQQTQVATVVPYFERFVQRFPTVESLAAADEGEVLRLWQGLGYYSRARRLHAAAKQIVNSHGGRVPGDLRTLLSLPGVGRYTAGAIASIAFDVRAPILDGNAIRVLARLFKVEQAVDDPAVRRRLWALAEAVVPEHRPGDVNQAVMELGATICLPPNAGGPRCLLCPVAGVCRARAAGVQAAVPVTSPKRATRAVEHHVLTVMRGGKVLLEQRAGDGLWANMWQMPTLEVKGGEAVDGERLRAWAQERLGLSVDPPRLVMEFDHHTTHRRIHWRLWRCDVTGGRLRRGKGQWRRPGDVDDLPLANPQRRAMRSITR